MTEMMNSDGAGLVYVSPASVAQEWTPDNRLWLRPLSIAPLSELAATLPEYEYLPLAGGPLGFTHLDMVTRRDKGYIAASVTIERARQIAGEAAEAQLEALCRPRAAFAGLEIDRPHIMGIVNVTPDSFSDGGRFLGAEAAIAHGRQMAAAGATILDIGGESTRPGAEPVTREEELARITPVISALSADGHLISAVTRHAAVMGPAMGQGHG